MRLLERWLSELTPSHRILDLGCGGGSLRRQLAGLRVTGTDIDAAQLAQHRDLPSACAESYRLPFAAASFDLVICHHSLEHFHDVPATIREIRRVLKPRGRLFASVPDGASFSDRLYRLLLCGGGHWQRFRFESLVRMIEGDTGLHLAGWSELSTSFIYVERRNFLPAPRGPLPGPLPRRMRWLGRFPSWSFYTARFALNLGSRFTDRFFSTDFSRYGWALAFSPEKTAPAREPGCWNVCMSCGSASEAAPPERVARLLYRCPYCAALNFFFGTGGNPRRNL
jgi:SAM-dependent methyltransferase